MPTAATTDQVQSVVFQALSDFGAEPDLIDREATFEALDVDSLDLAELAQIVEDRFGVALRSNDVVELVTVGDAIDLIAARAS